MDKRIELHSGRLVTLFHLQSTADWIHWEMHPAGDELVYLLSGSIDLILQEENYERIIELRSRAASIIPRGVWHRAIVHTPGEVLFITRGEGTQLRLIEEEWNMGMQSSSTDRNQRISVDAIDCNVTDLCGSVYS
jgi:oxalate decarboxylase/phosphoglucose isomerase-like protein (cupin superfamily)